MNVITYLKELVLPTTHISIKVNDHAHFEGGTIEGFVVIRSVVYPYNAIVQVKLKGISKWSYGIVVHTKQIAVVYEGEISERVQEIPFQFTLPKCAGSFQFKGGNINGKIYYYLKATKKSPSRPAKTLRYPIDVYERADNFSVPIRATNFDEKMHISVWTSKNVYFLDEYIILRIRINNLERSSTGPIGLALMHLAESRNFIGHSPAVISRTELSSEPAFYHGAKWVAFPVPRHTPLSSTRGPFRSILFLQITYALGKKMFLPITILAKQNINHLHPPPPIGAIPPDVLIRPLLLSPENITKCHLCEVQFNFLRRKQHCMHCGKVFCGDCVPSKIPIPKLRFSMPVSVCRPCARIVEETGGIKFQKGKKLMEEWGNRPFILWIPKYRKKEFNWVLSRGNGPYTECFEAVSQIL